MKVFWTSFAKIQLRKIFKYYKENVSLKIASKLVEEIVLKGNSLDFPEIGQREELLLHRQQEFRYLIYKSYKIIYWYNFNKNRIEIVDVFDVRQYPEKIKRNK